MLTTFDLDDYIMDAFRAGASGFLLKTAPLGLANRGKAAVKSCPHRYRRHRALGRGTVTA